MADKKRLFQPQIKEKWLFGMEPLEPIPLGPHCKRWYRTRDKLPPNCLAKHRNRLLKYPMDSRRWIFERDGLDDFRTGCPPADSPFIRGHREGFLPTTAHRIPKPPPKKTHDKLSEGAELLSKLSPAQQAGETFVEETEASLPPDPLARCPDLKESISPDRLLRMLEEIDPDKKLEDKWAYCEGLKNRKKSPTKVCEKRPEEVNPEPSEPSQPGTSQPTQPGTSQPRPPETSGPSQTGPPKQINLGPLSHVNRHLLNKSTWDLLANSTGDLPAKLTRDLPSKSTRDLPARLTWEQLVKSSWDLLARSTMNSRPSLLAPPGEVNQVPPSQVNQEPPKQVKRGLPKQINRRPPKQVNWGLPKQVNKGLPKKANRRPPKEVNWGFPGKVNQGPPKKANRGPPKEVNWGPPDQLSQGSPSQITPGAPDQVNQGPAKDSFLSYLMKLFPEEEKKKKSSRKAIPKTPDPSGYVEGEVSEFCKWTDDFGDMSIDEKFNTDESEIDDKCTPKHNMGKIKKVTQIPVELRYSRELDDNRIGQFPLQEMGWEKKLKKPPYPYRPKWVMLRYKDWYLNAKTSKTQIKDEPWVGLEVLKEKKYQSHVRDLQPDILDDLYGPIAFKDFIVSKGYRMPGVIEKLFLRKKWTYDSVKSPVDRVIKLLSKVPDDTSEDD